MAYDYDKILTSVKNIHLPTVTVFSKYLQIIITI